MKTVISPLTIMVFALGGFAQQADVTPHLKPDTPGGQGIDPPWDLLFYSNVEGTVGDNQLLGAECAMGEFFVTGGNSAGEPNQVYILDETGALIDQFDQWSSAGWGWRDLAYDGQYLYGSDDYTVDCFNLNGLPRPDLNIDGPLNPCRGLAYDPFTDHFWTASFSSDLYKFDRAGNVIWSGPSGLTGVYGLAWQEGAYGPWLWIFDQSGTPATTFYQFDPVDRVLTGVSVELDLMPTLTDQLAGGLFVSESYPYPNDLGGIVQGTPADYLFVVELVTCPMYVSVNLTYTGGSPVPAGGGNITFDLLVYNSSPWSPDVDVWLAVEHEGGDPTTLAMRTFEAVAPEWNVNRTGMFYPVPANWAGGQYELFLRAGNEPNLLWGQDSFTFTKEGAANSTAAVQPHESYTNPFFTENEVGSYPCKPPSYPPVDPWNIVFSSEAGLTTGDNQLLGGEFAYDQFFITGGNSTGEPNQLYILSTDGSLVDQFDQWSSEGWGWRDLAFDGTYFYGSDDYTIDCFDRYGNPVPEMNITGPYSPNRALAYDPITDHFWTASFSSDLYEFDREGNVIWSGPTGLTGVYGAAWNNQTGMLWLHDQTGGCDLREFNPVTHELTGWPDPLPLLPGSTDQMAGGLFYTDEWNNYPCLGGVAQATPEDQVFIVRDMFGPPYPVIVDIIYVSGSPVPAGGGDLVFDCFMQNVESTPLDFEAWLSVSYEGGEPTRVAMRSFTDFQPNETLYRPAMWYPIPGHWPGGDYFFYLFAGEVPYSLYSQDYFGFDKEGIADAGFVPFQATGAPDPFAAFETDETVAIADEFVLHGAYPNPFNPSTVLSYELRNASVVNLAVYDVHGRKVADLVDGWRDAGVHEVTFDAGGLASGMYFYRLMAGEFSGQGKMVLMK